MRATRAAAALALALGLAPAAAAPPVPLTVYEGWHSMSNTDKLDWLLDTADWLQLRLDFEEMDADGDGTVTISEFFAAHEEFASPAELSKFYGACAEAAKEAGVVGCQFRPYCVARGAFDKHGTPYLSNELEMREIMMVEEMEDLIDGNVDNILGLKFDADGNIIDEL
mmetsp:Transcript_34503/g.108633  ORF Transcript_34503/g.108633 Transcript_34503/m.108633 type:complete len:168 (-) Transcript_34503:280-783(-)